MTVGQDAASARALAERLPRARLNEPLWRQTSYRIGGPADVFMLATTSRQMIEAVTLAVEWGLPWRVIGAASNLLIADEGVDGLVVKAVTRAIRQTAGASGETLIHADAGCVLASLAKRIARSGLAGLEWASTVPGTVGAAVVNNSGAFGSCTAEHLVSADLFFPGEGSRTVDAADLGHDYRSSHLKSGHWSAVVLSATFRARRGDPDVLVQQLAELDTRRRATQPIGPSVGSVFRNPPDDFAGALIERAGLKGERRGDAEISPLHANFILNRGAARARDVLALVRDAQQTVWQQYRVRLIPEIQLVGRWSPEDLALLAGPPP